MHTLYFTRHGETVWNVENKICGMTDSPLTERGRAQARALGQKVKAGQVIGYTGQTGRATTPHLHFELRFKSRTINPGVFFDHANYKLKANVLTLGRNGSVR